VTPPIVVSTAVAAGSVRSVTSMNVGGGSVSTVKTLPGLAIWPLAGPSSASVEDSSQTAMFSNLTGT
jgi:hypothetical protein